jgi:hypothetical protein
MVDFIGFMMLAEGESKPHRRQNEGDCGAPVARFGVWVGPFQIRMTREKQMLKMRPVGITMMWR